MNEKQKKLIDALDKSLGIITVACESCGISRDTYYRWLREDQEFAAAVEAVNDKQIDFVESRLLNLVKEGDSTATIFYLKTKGKNRGYSEKTAGDVPELVVRFVQSGVPLAHSEREVRERLRLEGEEI